MTSTISEIVAGMPRVVSGLFRRFETARDRLVLTQVAEALNRADVDETWFEIFRDIYILSKQEPRSDTDGVRKNPRAFVTFARAAEPQMFKPEFWFGKCADPRFEFERYLYSRTGGGVWGAMDWEMDLYLQTRIYAAVKSDETLVLKRIAALALTVRAIVAGELGLYVEERNDVKLPLSGVTNTVGETPLLSYYHYDRFTQLSFARAGEEVNAIRFEPRWLALAVLSDVILKEADARSTLTSAKRVALESLAQAMLRIKMKLNAASSHQAVLLAAETLYRLVTEAPERFGELSEAELVKLIGVDARLLKRERMCPRAESFWRDALPHFETISEAYDREAQALTEARDDEDAAKDDQVVRFVGESLARGKAAELAGEVGRVPLRAALKRLIAEGTLVIEPKTLAGILFDAHGVDSLRLKIGRKSVRLKANLLFDAAESREWQSWAVAVLEAMSEADAREKNQKPIIYRRVDWAKVLESVDRIWNFYFTEDRICRDRWIVSIARALEILDEAERKKYATYAITSTFNWPSRAVLRLGLKTRLLAEKAKFEAAGEWPSDLAALKKELEASDSVTIEDVLSGEARILVMIAILARLKVRTRKEFSDLWSSRDDLFGLFTHILIASNRNFDLPFPWHLDITSGSYLRLGRTHARQANVIDALVEERFFDRSEELLYKTFLAYED